MPLSSNEILGEQMGNCVAIMATLMGGGQDVF